MPVEHVETFLASVKRCLAIPSFLGTFYEIFMASSDEVREKFSKTDFERQTRMVADSLYALAVAAQGQFDSPAWAEMPRIAARHGHRELNIRPELYDQWLECLLESARRFDPEFSPEIEAAWRKTLAVGIEYMRSQFWK